MDKRTKQVIETTRRLYRYVGWKAIFSYIRFWDAPFVELERLLPKKGRIVELGCGEGLFSNFIAVCEGAREVVGIDIDGARVKDARRGLKNARFVKANVLRKNLEKADVFLMVHLLHHLSKRQDQVRLIRKIRAKIKKGGKLVIAEVCESPRHKYLISYFTDLVVVPMLFDKKLIDRNFHYRKKSEWERVLKNEGFSVRAISAHKGKPFSHVIFECKV